jgi:hypothetical protein
MFALPYEYFKPQEKLKVALITFEVIETETQNMAFLNQSVDEYLQRKKIVSQFLTFILASYLIQ